MDNDERYNLLDGLPDSIIENIVDSLGDSADPATLYFSVIGSYLWYLVEAIKDHYPEMPDDEVILILSVNMVRDSSRAIQCWIEKQNLSLEDAAVDFGAFMESNRQQLRSMLANVARDN